MSLRASDDIRDSVGQLGRRPRALVVAVVAALLTGGWPGATMAARQPSPPPARPAPTAPRSQPAGPSNPSAASRIIDRLKAQRRAYVKKIESSRPGTRKAPGTRTAPARSGSTAPPATTGPTAVSAGPPARSGAPMAYDQATQQLLLFGGDEGSLQPNGAYQVAPSNDTWVYSGGGWTQLSPAHSPPGRVAAAMAYDAATQQVILFGGGDCSPCNDTWAWNGSDWTQLQPAHSPPMLIFPAMAYDAATSSVVLFGGDCPQTSSPGCDPAVNLSNGTWIWNGTDWSMASPAQSPPGFEYYGSDGLAFDPASQTVMFDTTGGISDGSAPVIGTTWEWNGTTWTNTAVQSPGVTNGLLGENLAFDAGTNSVVYHGFGTLSDFQTFAEQTWSWNGTQWSQLPVPDTPRRVGDGMAFSGAANLLVQFGGSSPSFVNTADTYTFDGGHWSGSGPAATEIPSPGLDSFRPHCDCGQPVDTASGNFWHTFTDFAIPGRGLALSFSRTYNSIDAGTEGRLGFGWIDSYGAHLTVDPTTGNVTLFDESGGALTYTAGGGGLQAPPRVLSPLTKNSDGSFTLTRHDLSKLTFDTSGRLVQETDRNGYATILAYSGSQLTSVIDPAGRSLALAYNSSGLLASVTDPLPRTVSYSYDASGNLTGVVDPAVGSWSFTYDSAHHLLSMTDPRLGTLSNAYDSSGRVTSQTDPLGRMTTYSYQPGQTLETDARSIPTLYVYADGQLTAKTVNFNGNPSSSYSYVYGPNMAPIVITDPNGGQTTQTWDPSGNLLSRTDANNHKTVYQYNGFNEQTSVTDANGVTTTLTYDASGNPTQISTPLSSTSSSTTSYTYGDLTHPGDVTALTDPNGNKWSYAYDADGDRTSATDPLGGATTWAYDAAGRVTSKTSANGSTTSYAYDALDDLTKVTLPLSGSPTATYAYDADRNRTSYTDADGKQATYVYDADNEQTELHRPDGTVLKTTYDGDGNVSGQVDGLGQTLAGYTYDNLNHLSASTDGLNRQTGYFYDRLGRLAQVTDPAGRTTSYGHDSAGNLTSISYSDGKTPNVSIAYDALDQRTSMSDGTGTSKYTYDALHHLTGYTNGAGATLSFSYDLKGQQTGITYPGANQVSRGYDAAGRLSSVTDWLGHKTSFAYDPDGNLTQESYPNQVVATFTYDGTDRLTSVADALGGSSILQLSYSRSSAGLVTQQGQTSYAYDAADRLTSAGSSAPVSYTYDAADRVTGVSVQGGTSTTLSYDAADQPAGRTSSDGTSLTYTYDSSGNRTGQTDQTGVATSLTYDQANRLTAFGSSATYTYDGDGLRAGKSVSGSAEAFTWDVSQQLPVLLQDGGTSYVTGPGGLPLEQVSSGGSVLYYHQDELGSTRALTDQSGAVQATYAYDAYGQVTSTTGSVSNPLTFAGGFSDSESGLLYLRARYYEPSTGQFITRDPLTAATGEPYAYAHDDPATNTDLSGLYDYQYQWYIGSASQVGSPQKVMAYFEQHAQDIFPFYLGGCDVLTAGTKCDLQPTDPWHVAPVEVIQVTSTSFTFKALKGHFDLPGSTITFSIFESNCDIYLEQTAHAKLPNPFLDFIAPIIAANQWAQQAENLRIALVPGYQPLPYPVTD